MHDAGDRLFVGKTTTTGDPGRMFVKRVRLFEPSDVSASCTGAGFVVKSRGGYYDGSALRDDPPRAIPFAGRR